MATTLCGVHEIVPSDFAACAHDPVFTNATNSTGCCRFRDGFVPGVCAACPVAFSCPTSANEDSFPWGVLVAIIADVAISVGLALQKVGHMKVEQRVTMCRQTSGDLAAEEEKKAHGFTKERIWWVGLVLTIGAEIGNFAAYGDPNTPSPVVGRSGVQTPGLAAAVCTALGEPCAQLMSRCCAPPYTDCIPRLHRGDQQLRDLGTLPR